MANKKALPIGISDFKRLREDNYYYIDMTDIIDKIVKDGASVNLFTRPRRFGNMKDLKKLLKERE